MIIHYIGDGKRYTGDWCFHDGFVTFSDLAALYLQLLRGRVLTIISDCSYSGSWVRECMIFLDRQGVRPCGHSATEKGILLKVYSSCMSHQVPRQLAHVAYGFDNNRTTGELSFSRKHGALQDAEIVTAQYAHGYDFTLVRCGQSFEGPCWCLPQVNWQTWSSRSRIFIVSGTDKDSSVWHVVLVVDDDSLLLQFLENMDARGTLDYTDFGSVLLTSCGEWPTAEERAAAMLDYQVYQ